MNEIKIERMTEKSWPDVVRIYESGIATKNGVMLSCSKDAVKSLVLIDTLLIKARQKTLYR